MSSRKAKEKTPTKQQRDRVARTVQKWKKRLLMEAHSVEVRFQGRNFPDDEEPDRAAEAQSGWPYLTHTLWVYPCFWEGDATYQDSAILHEMIHLVLGAYAELLSRAADGHAPNRSERRDVNEATTDWLTRIIWGGEVHARSPRELEHRA